MKTETRDRHDCSGCGRRFVVVYRQVDRDEPPRSVPVACPYCNAVNRVSVASAAASGAEYWAEKIAP